MKKKRYNNILNEIRILNSDNKNKCMWTIYDEIIGKHYRPSNFPIRQTLLDTSSANDYNKYLTNVIPDLFANVKMIPFQYDIAFNNNSMYLKPLTPDDIVKISNNIKNKYSSGNDEIPSIIIKWCI